MKDNRDLEETRSKPVVDPVSQGGPQRMNEGRRRFAKAGLAAPVVITLASRPVWGRECSPSAIWSGNLSDPVDMSTCEGCSPGYWMNHPTNSWPAAFQPDDIFNTIFNRDAFFNTDMTPQTLLEVMYNTCSNGKTTSLEKLGFHTVAALLNAEEPQIAFQITPETVIKSFQDAFDSEDHETLKNTFDQLNNQGCPLAGPTDPPCSNGKDKK